MLKIDSFSENSLKVLDRDVEEFKNKYLYNLTLFKKDKRADLGQKFHSLICYYIKGFSVEKLLLNLNEKEISFWKNLQAYLEPIKKGFIKTEYSFLVKNMLKDTPYYLTGRFDAIYQENDTYTIYDWKTLTLPKDCAFDIQTVVYLYCAAKIFNTDKINMKYLSIEKLETQLVPFEAENIYKKRIDDIVAKIL